MPASEHSILFEQAIADAIADRGTSHVSFDVFDTLLIRPVLEPADAFHLIEWRLHAQGVRQEFRVARRRAARQASSKLSASREEATLEEIHDALCSAGSVDARHRGLTLTMELETERRLCRARERLRPLVEVARRSGKTLVALSDTYFSAAFVHELLTKAGFGDVSRCFVSSETGLTKASGGLYRHALTELGCSPERLVHVGDKRGSDRDVPRRLGICAFHLPSAVASFFGRSAYADLWVAMRGELPVEARFLVALVMHHAFDTSAAAPARLFGGSPELMGYAGLGPVALLPTSQRWLDHPFGEQLCTATFDERRVPAHSPLEDVARGIDRFLSDAESTFGTSTLGPRISRELALRPLLNFLCSPSQRDAAPFVGVELPRGVVIDATQDSSLWPEGYAARTAKHPERLPIPWLRKAELRLLARYLGPTAQTRLYHSPEPTLAESGRRSLRFVAACRRAALRLHDLVPTRLTPRAP